MTNELFRQMINSAFLGTVLFVIAVGLWVVIFNNLTLRKR